MILSNAFSINMLTNDVGIYFSRISLEDARAMISECLQTTETTGETCVNAIGHADTDRLVRGLLGIDELAPGQRMNVVWPLDNDTTATMVVAQYRGPRLQEGATSLPEGAVMEWWCLTAPEM